MKKTIIAYKRERESSLVITGQRVIDKMSDNPAFPDPPAALYELKKVLPEFQDALAKAMGRDLEMVSAKNNKKAFILSLLDELATYVVEVCNGDRLLMLSSGFDITEERGGMPPPSVETLLVELGCPGEATTRVKKAIGAIAFIHQYAMESPGPGTMWVSEGSSQRSYLFRKLTSEKRYWFRVVAIGCNGQRAYSPVVSRVIQ